MTYIKPFRKPSLYEDPIKITSTADTNPYNPDIKYIAPAGGTYSVFYNGKTYTVTVKKDEDLHGAIMELIKNDQN